MRQFNGTLLPRPRKTAALGPFSGPTDIEIGSGQGLHAIQYCTQNPYRRLIAIERTQNKFAAFSNRILRHPHLTNLVAVNADAVSWIQYSIPDRSVERMFLLYPNPYPKGKQRNLRWHQSPCMAMLKAKLTNDGRIYLATNLLWYADEAEGFMTSQWGFKLESRGAMNDVASARTHFERKYLLRGETCHDMVFQIQ